VPMLRARLLRPAPSAERVAALIADLDAGAFAPRERAGAELRELGRVVEPALKRALEAGPTIEAHRRLERLLKDITGPGERARPVRAVQALEYANTPAARTLLKDLAAGPADEPLSQEAKAALERLRH
jgi:hypothetical protein